MPSASDPSIPEEPPMVTSRLFMTTRVRAVLAAMVTTTATTGMSAALAQDAGEGYRLPPPEVVAMLDAPPTPAVSVSPDGTSMILVHRENLPPIREMARPMERLAGLRLDAATNGRHGPRR